MSVLQQHKIDFRVLDRSDVPTRSVTAGTVILSEGDIAKEMFLVRQGTVEIKVHGREVEDVGPGGIFGEMALIDHESRSASAIAKTDCDLVPIDERLFIILVQDAPYFALDVMRVLTERIRSMNKLV
jgi:CRP-like cAMP-binding protein